MEFVNLIAELVTKVGFPIACCCVLFNQNSSLQKTLTDIQITMQKMTDELDRIADNRKENEK